MRKLLLYFTAIITSTFLCSSCVTSSKQINNYQISESKIIEFGIFDISKPPRQHQGANPDGTEFFTRLPWLINSTTEIPIKTGLSFGVTYQTWGTPVGSEFETDVKIVSSSENMILLESKVISKFGRWANTCWSINSENPSLVGNYKIQIFHKDRLLVEKKFTMLVENIQE